MFATLNARRIMAMNDDVKALVERLNGWCTDWDGSQMVRGEPPRDGLHCDDLMDAAAALTAQAEEIERLKKVAFGPEGSAVMRLAYKDCGIQFNMPHAKTIDGWTVLENCNVTIDARAALKAAQEVKA